MSRPFNRRARSNRYKGPVPTKEGNNVFFYSYNISQAKPSQPVIFSQASDLNSKSELASSSGHNSELVFLTGYPSPEWLNAIVTRYRVDHRFFHRHLDFLPSGQREWYTAPDVPSRSQHFIRLLVPSIVFLGPEGRYMPMEDLQKARTACSEQLRHKFKSFFGGSSISTGQSIVRHVNIHSGDAMVLEQAITVTILNHENTVKSACSPITVPYANWS